MSVDPWNIFTGNFGTVGLPYTALVTLLDIGFFFFTTFKVAKARGKHKISAPFTDGPEEFLRVFRVQMNTLEQMMIHLPLLWISAFAMDDVFAASFGFVWLFSRIIYARGYYRKAKSRAKGFLLGMVMNAVLFAGAIAGVIASL